MWLIDGEERFSIAVEQAQNDSDRAAGLVAAAIVETRLEAAMKRRLKENETVAARLFRHSAPLGTFSAKIDLSMLMGMLTDAAYNDLVVMKNIRNDFAHRLDVTDFSNQSVRDKCFNLRLPEIHYSYISEADLQSQMDRPPEEHLAEVRDMLANPKPRAAAWNWRSTTAKDDLIKPRRRYMLTAQILNQAFGSTRWAPTNTEELI